jgi:Domain of unknown function (DUF4263)
MKIRDVIFQYSKADDKEPDSICRVRIFSSPEGKTISLLTDIADENPGVSVTDSVETIRRSLIQQGMITSGTVVIEHYEPESFRKETFDLVRFSESGMPSWTPIRIDEVCRITGAEMSEFKERTIDHRHLAFEAERLAIAIDSQLYSPRRSQTGDTVRIADISGKIFKKCLADLIQVGATERDLQRLLKSDLSVFGKMYAKPAEEYICFSEFPIASGFVDFAVFSGRSRMDVTLIEVKGANFDLVNQDAYGKFSAKIDTALHQMRERLDHNRREPRELWKLVHQIRAAVESGKSIYNSLIGPRGPLYVDPQKEIIIHCVVIGGRTRNDLDESRKRHIYETTSSPPIKIESWDTWLNKLV